MKIKNIFKLIVALVVCVVIVGVGTQKEPTNTRSDASFGWRFPVAKLPETEPDKKLIAYSDIRDPGGIPQGLPVRLKIPAIGVDSTIEDAFITNDGRMDVPAGTINVAWYALGPHPGMEGSAVIGGHYGIYEANKGPAVFYNLDKLNVGNKVYIEDDTGDTLAFVVRSIKSFDRNADATTVFTSSDGLSHLNLITCEGTWNRVNDSYPNRLVVFTDEIPAEGAVVVNKKQTLVVTKAKITTTAVPTEKLAVLPTSAPEEVIAATQSVKNPSVTPQILIASAKSLYATPVDGLITSFLLISIGLTTFKIIRR